MKNESQHIKRWADAASESDYLILLDTGSTDDSVNVARDLGITVHQKTFNPWHFANARNYLLDLLPEDVDWILNVDVDEMLGKGWRQALEKVPTDGSINRPRYRLYMELVTI